MFKVGDRVGEVYGGGFDRQTFIDHEYYYGVIAEVHPDDKVLVKWDDVWVWSESGQFKYETNQLVPDMPARKMSVLKKVWLDGRGDKYRDGVLVPTYILMLEDEMKSLGEV